MKKIIAEIFSPKLMKDIKEVLLIPSWIRTKELTIRLMIVKFLQTKVLRASREN